MLPSVLVYKLFSLGGPPRGVGPLGSPCLVYLCPVLLSCLWTEGPPLGAASCVLARVPLNLLLWWLPPTTLLTTLQLLLRATLVACSGPLGLMGMDMTRLPTSVNSLGCPNRLAHPRTTLGGRDVKSLGFRFIIKKAFVITLQTLLRLLWREWPRLRLTSPFLLPSISFIGLLKGQEVVTLLFILVRSVRRLGLTLPIQGLPTGLIIRIANPLGVARLGVLLSGTVKVWSLPVTTRHPLLLDLRRKLHLVVLTRLWSTLAIRKAFSGACIALLALWLLGAGVVRRLHNLVLHLWPVRLVKVSTLLIRDRPGPLTVLWTIRGLILKHVLQFIVLPNPLNLEGRQLLGARFNVPSPLLREVTW